MGKFKDALTGAPLTGKVVVIDGAAVRESSDGTADVLIDPDAKLISVASFKEFFAMEDAAAAGPEPGLEEKFVKAKAKIVELEEKLEDYQHYEDTVNEVDDDYYFDNLEDSDSIENTNENDATLDELDTESTLSPDGKESEYFEEGLEGTVDITYDQSLDFDEEGPALEVKDPEDKTLLKVKVPKKKRNRKNKKV